MRKLAVMAMLALVIGMIPMTTAGSQVEAEAVGNVRVQNFFGVPVDVWIETDGGFQKVSSNLAANQSFDTLLAVGDRDIVACGVNSTDETCAGAGGVVLAAGTLAVADGGNYTVSIEPGAPPTVLFITQNDTSPTANGQARFTVRNGFPAGALISICVDGEPVIVDLAPLTADAAELPAGQDLETNIYIGAPFVSCAAAPTAQQFLDYAAGTNFVLTFSPLTPPGFPACTSACGQVILVGQEAPVSDGNLTVFCETLPQLQGVQTTLQELFGAVEVGNPDTYPSVEEVQDTADEIQALITAGDESVPSSIADAWFTATAGLRDLLAGLAAAGYDLNAIPQPSLQDIVDGVNNPPPPSPEDLEAQDMLAAFFIGSCAAAPIDITPTFTG